MDIDYEQLEEELDIVIPDIYKMFIDATSNFDLEKYHIYFNTEQILKGNWDLRLALSDSSPTWKHEYFCFGVGDGCGNYYFLPTSDEKVDLMQLWAHDPPGIEDVSLASQFFKELLSELELGMKGPNWSKYQGMGQW